MAKIMVVVGGLQYLIIKPAMEMEKNTLAAVLQVCCMTESDRGREDAIGKIPGKTDESEIADLKTDGKKIILFHRVFDLIHSNHIIHFQEVKKMGIF